MISKERIEELKAVLVPQLDHTYLSALYWRVAQPTCGELRELLALAEQWLERLTQEQESGIVLTGTRTISKGDNVTMRLNAAAGGDVLVVTTAPGRPHQGACSCPACVPEKWAGNAIVAQRPTMRDYVTDFYGATLKSIEADCAEAGQGSLPNTPQVPTPATVDRFDEQQYLFHLEAELAKVQQLIQRAVAGLTQGACFTCGAEPGCNIDCPSCLWIADAREAIAQQETPSS